MASNISIRKLSIGSGSTSEIYSKLNKTVSRAAVYRWYVRITRGVNSLKPKENCANKIIYSKD